MDKEKQIKEMVKDIYRLSKMPPPMIEGLGEWSDTISEYLINVGYRKINDNEVVISKKEYKNLKKELKDMEEQRDRQAYITEELIQDKHLWTEQASKETARAYHDKMQKIIHERDYIEGYAEIGLQEENDEIAKQFGVDLEEQEDED